jgi:hypothetical protein
MKPGLQPPGVSIDTEADERGRMGNLSSTAATKSPSRRSSVRERKVKVLLGEWQETLRSTVREMRSCSSLNQSCLVSVRSTNLAVLIRIGGLFLLPTRFARLARWLAFASLGVLAMLGFSAIHQSRCFDPYRWPLSAADALCTPSTVACICEPWRSGNAWFLAL